VVFQSYFFFVPESTDNLLTYLPSKEDSSASCFSCFLDFRRIPVPINLNPQLLPTKLI